MTHDTIVRPEPLAALLARLGRPASPASIPRVSLSAALAAGDDSWRVLSYLSGCGHAIASLDDLLAVNDDPEEDEIGAHAVEEGVALSRASDGFWLVFTP